MTTENESIVFDSQKMTGLRMMGFIFLCLSISNAAAASPGHEDPAMLATDPTAMPETAARNWLETQRSQKAVDGHYLIPGKIASRSYQRYLDSFTHRIPRLFFDIGGGTTPGTTGWSAGGGANFNPISGRGNIATESPEPTDVSARTHRSAAAKAEFQRIHPCPSTGDERGPCPGYVVDHIQPLACGGRDAPDNMQWQTQSEAKAKDKWERLNCERR